MLSNSNQASLVPAGNLIYCILRMCWTRGIYMYFTPTDLIESNPTNNEALYLYKVMARNTPKGDPTAKK